MNKQIWKNRIKREQRIQLAAFLVTIALLGLMLLKVNNLLVSFVLAFVISYMFGPIVNLLERKGFSRTVSIFSLFVISGVIITLLVVALYPVIFGQLNEFREVFPTYVGGLTNTINSMEEKLYFLSDFLGTLNIGETFERYMRIFTQSIFEDLPQILSKSLTTAFLAPLLAFFMLKDGSKFRKMLFSMVPNNIFELTLNLQHQINSQMGGFIRARLLEAAFVGVVTWIGLWSINFPFAPILAFFAAITNLIPYIGPVIGMVPALIISFINGDGFIGLIITSIPYLIAQVIDVFFIIPIVVAKIVDLHAITVILSLIIGAQLMGVLGMIIAIPVTSALKVTVTNVYRHILDFRS